MWSIINCSFDPLGNQSLFCKNNRKLSIAHGMCVCVCVHINMCIRVGVY